MTKHIRVENADTSNFRVAVEVWDKGQNGQPDRLAKTINLDYPTAMTPPGECYLTSTRYLVIRELPSESNHAPTVTQGSP